MLLNNLTGSCFMSTWQTGPHIQKRPTQQEACTTRIHKAGARNTYLTLIIFVRLIVLLIINGSKTSNKFEAPYSSLQFEIPDCKHTADEMAPTT